MVRRNSRTGEKVRHPGSSQSRRRLFLTGSLVLGTAVFLFTAASPAQEKGSPGKAKPAAQRGMPVESAKVKVMTISQEIQAVGTLNANESVTVAPEIAGRVTSIAFSEGQRVAGGQILIRLDSSIYKAQRDRAEASLALSRANLERSRLLFKEDAISQRELQQADAQWKLDEANLRLARAQLGKTVLKAPFKGVLGLRNISVGEYIQPGQPIVTLDDIDTIKVDFWVPEVYSSRLNPGQEIQMTIDAFPGRIFTGKVNTVDPAVDPKSRSMLVRAKVPNKDGTLKPGMYAQIQLILKVKPNALMIPEEALFSRGQEKLVYKVVNNKVVEAVVKIGQRQKGLVEITGGLSPGDTIITAGQIKVRPGMPVTLLPAAGGN